MLFMAYLGTFTTQPQPHVINDDLKPATRDGQIVTAREIAAAAQVRSGTRVIEITTVRVTVGGRSWDRFDSAAYDSAHPDEREDLGFGPDLDQARTAAVRMLAPSAPGEYCACWSGWDPDCGQRGCWGSTATA